MYSEIKNNSQILINRLDDNEKILLKSIYDISLNSDINFKALDGETGEFDGMMINIVPKQPKKLELNGVIASMLNIYQKEDYEYEFPVLDTDIDILIKHNNIYLKAFTENNALKLFPKEVLEDEIQYEIRKEGYESIYGTIQINAVVRDTVKVTIETNVEDAKIDIFDKKCIKYIPEFDDTYNLPVGAYDLIATKEDYEIYKAEIEITNDDLININKTLNIELVEKGKVALVRFKLINKDSISSCRVEVIDPNLRKMLPEDIDKVFGVYTYHLPKGSYTYKGLCNNEEFEETSASLNIDDGDLGKEKSVDVLINKAQE